MTRQYTTPVQKGITAVQSQTVSISITFEFDPDPTPGNGAQFTNGSFAARYKAFDANGAPDPSEDIGGSVASIAVADMPPQQRTRINQLIQYAEELGETAGALPPGTSADPLP